MTSGRSLRREGGEPAAGRLGLPVPQFGKRHVDVAEVDGDLVQPGFIGCVARDIALALAMPHQPQFRRPILPHALPPSQH